ncbi:MAG: single-stranded-DNA-specific exonuclease RecJ [Candidatus Margulisbacteria bacterium]|nr:single-stranded-DNA-specific exonuclease RecJ [Candidatus Margulisiibacteriota bacterium]
MNDSIWQICGQQCEVANALAQQIAVSPQIAAILINRGITDFQKADAFLHPKLAHLRDPMQIPAMEKAAKRVLVAKEKGEKVVVYGDYDVDGVTGTAIIVLVLRFLGINASYYIPHRYGEGYSLSIDATNKIAGDGTKLIITVDCGIASAAEVEEANKLGMEVIVTDHHNIPPQLPPAFALVNPKLIAADHPSKNLSGAGVAFKFAWAVLKTAGIKDAAFLTSLLDLAALGTFSDVVPLSEENRVLAVNGLRMINERERIGIKHLIEAAGLNGDITEDRVYFMLAPRINAAGRLEHASKAVELFLSDDPQVTRELAAELGRINTRRQGIGETIRDDVFGQISEEYVKANRVIALHGDNWHPGVIGIVASKVAEHYWRPTVLIGINEGVGRGSARSINGISIYELLDSCRDLFLDFGGHEGAAGFEITLENIPEFERRVKETADRLISDEDLKVKIQIDAELDPAEINLALVKELDKLAPYGEGNQPPVFASYGLQIESMRQVGSGGKHLKLKLKKDNASLDVIGFGFGHLYNQLSYDRLYDFAYNLEANLWEGFERVQLGLVDVKLSLPPSSTSVKDAPFSQPACPPSAGKPAGRREKVSPL